MKRIRIVQLGNLYFGRDLVHEYIEDVVRKLPTLAPDLVVMAGGLTQRARHSEFVGARSYVGTLEGTCPVLAVPGVHDVEWWWRPYVPFRREVIYANYRRYFGSELARSVKLRGAVVAAALTTYGMALAAFTPRLGNMPLRGYLPKSEMLRVRQMFAGAGPTAARVLVVHHDLLGSDPSPREGLARSRRARRRIVEAGTELALCGHDHAEAVSTIDGKVVLSCVGTLSRKRRDGRHPSFNVIDIEADRFNIALYPWDVSAREFRLVETHAFARHVTYQDIDSAPSPATVASHG